MVKRSSKSSKLDIGSKKKLDEGNKPVEKKPPINSNRLRKTAQKKRKGEYHDRPKACKWDVDIRKRVGRKKVHVIKTVKWDDSNNDNQVDKNSVNTQKKGQSSSVTMEQTVNQISDNVQKRKTRSWISSEIEHSESKRPKLENDDFGNKNQEKQKLSKQSGNTCKRDISLKSNTMRIKNKNPYIGKSDEKQRKSLKNASSSKCNKVDFNEKDTLQQRVTKISPLKESKQKEQVVKNDTNFERGQGMKTDLNTTNKKVTKRKNKIPKKILKSGEVSINKPPAESNKLPMKKKTGKTDKGKKAKIPDTASKKTFSNNRINIKEKKSRKNKAYQTPNRFLNKFMLSKTIELTPRSSVHGISISEDNLAWINFLDHKVNLIDSEGHIFKTYDTEAKPVLSACTAEGDLLFTSGCAGKPRVYRIRRAAEPSISLFANLSKFGSELYGLHVAKNGHLFVLAVKKKITKMIELSQDGKVQDCIEMSGFRSRVIEVNGQIRVMETHSCDILPLPGSSKSEEKIALHCHSSNFYSGSAYVDRFGNIMIGCSNVSQSIWIFDNLGNHLHTLPVECTTGKILSIATDHNDNIWFGTYSGTVFVGKYLQNS